MVSTPNKKLGDFSSNLNHSYLVFMGEWPSGLWQRTTNAPARKGPWVQIPPPPPYAAMM